MNPLVLLAVVACEVRNLLHARLLIDSGRFAEIERIRTTAGFRNKSIPRPVRWAR